MEVAESLLSAHQGLGARALEYLVHQACGPNVTVKDSHTLRAQ